MLPKFVSVCASLTLFAVLGSAHAVVVPNALAPDAEDAVAAAREKPAPRTEAERIERLKTAEDEVDFLDNATADEIAEAYQIERFPKIQNSEPTPEQVANAAMTVVVSLSQQRLTVRSGMLTDSWNISSGIGGKHSTTKGGPFFIQSLSPNHVSKLYPINKRTGKRGGARMPCAIFHNGDEAFHATGEVSLLGSPASHGCVRSSHRNACRLYNAAEYYNQTAGPGSVVFYIRN